MQDMANMVDAQTLISQRKHCRPFAVGLVFQDYTCMVFNHQPVYHHPLAAYCTKDSSVGQLRLEGFDPLNVGGLLLLKQQREQKLNRIQAYCKYFKNLYNLQARLT